MHKLTEGVVCFLDEGSLIPTMQIEEVFSFHDKPDSLNRIEVW